MHRALAFTALLVAAALQPAAAINDNAGTTGFNFLKVGVGARPAALGGAFVGAPASLEAVAWNPAGLLGVPERAATVSVAQYLMDTQAGFLSVAMPGERRVWGVSLNYFTYGDMRRTDADGLDLGSFGAADMAAYLTVAQRLWSNRLVVGANLKAVYSSIDEYSADAYMADLGLLLSGPLKGLTLGASLSNVGVVRSGYTDSFTDSLPVIMRFGLAHRPAHTPVPMMILADLNVPNDNDAYLAFGVELRIAGGLYLRPGYSTQQTGQDEEALGLTTGAGIELQGYRLDYAYNSYAELGDVHRLSLTGGF